MRHRTLALTLGLVAALLGTAALPALGQESPSPSPSPSAEATIGAADDLALVVASAVPDELAVDLAAGLGADLLDETGEPDREAAIAALGGWSELLLPGLTELAGDDPELLALLEAFARSDDLEAAVQADLAAALEDAAPTNEPPNEGLGPMGFLSAVRGPGAAAPVAPAAEGPAGSDGLSGANMADLAVLLNFIKEVLGPEVMREVPAFNNKEVKNGVNQSQSLDLGGADGEAVVSIEFEKDGQKLGGSLRFRLKGDPCPDADGTVTMEFKVQRDGAVTATAGSAGFGDGFEGTATGHVDDSATLTGYEVEGRATTRKTVPGRSASVETTTKNSFGMTRDTDGTIRLTLRDEGLIRPSRWSSQAKGEDAQRAIENGQQLHQFVLGVFANWQGLWRNGWCVKVKADIPATSQPSEQHGFDVHVVHKDGSELDAPVDATLSGPKSLDPLRIDQAPGQLTYTAGDKDGDSGTIELVSTSRRGIGTLKKTVVVEEEHSYQATSIPGVRTWTGACIDALDRGPIVLEWKDTSPGRTIKGVFTLDPSSETEGTLTWESTGKGPGWSLKNRAQGTYRIEVSATRDDGSPSELLVVHSTKGTVRTCAGGRCTTKKADLGEGTIPLDVLSGKCPVTP